jgi:hypothetical protein
MSTEQEFGKATADEIAAWKSKGENVEVFEIGVDTPKGKVYAYLIKDDTLAFFQVLSMYAGRLRHDAVGAAEFLFDKLVVKCTDDFKTSAKVRMAAVSFVNQIEVVAQGELRRL